MLDVRCVYVGGEVEYPNYEAIGDHTEGVTVVFDASVLTYRQCLDHFFSSVSPYYGCSDKRQYANGVWWHDEVCADPPDGAACHHFELTTMLTTACALGGVCFVP